MTKPHNLPNYHEMDDARRRTSARLCRSAYELVSEAARAGLVLTIERVGSPVEGMGGGRVDIKTRLARKFEQ